MKCFIKKTAEYSAKNKLLEAMKNALSGLDRTLYASHQEAIDDIAQVLNEVALAYNGSASMPTVSNYEPEPGTHVVKIQSITLSLYEVKNT